MSASQAISTAKAGIDTSIVNLLQSALAVCFGLMIIGLVGFSHIDVLHNAAHDSRHANAFPCH
ncbi:CbtB domain-containing protein [Allomesorhizobium alhagi]|uniref:Putative transmembrane protein n=1 Tax=Mesorhizobium alhagi CCNWXJ12-2 TaxID=1107882 RepID=H0I3T7_9HYPH|nr:CbtB domain-containing protein [Mesorhizobium alhagi]EHK52352.1 putative transmembrane protein [Mesorhizobium alhagi CCNWXJ12-2]